VHVVASDPDGDPLTYAWTKVSGAGTTTFATPNAADSGVTFSAASTYVLRVTVSDGRGGSVTSDVSVTVNAGSGVDPRADLNHDGVVNALDLQIIIANFGKTVGTPGCDARADANADGVVNALDLQIVIANFGQTVP
jgi:hypothetical protein